MGNQTDTKLNWAKYLFLVAIIILPNLFPFVQLVLTQGYLFYQNAFDEYGYLSYEAASYETSFLRISSYLVKWLHEWGFSSGYINFIFDLICPGLIAYFTFKNFLLLGFEKNKSFLAAVLFMMIPILAGGSNPVYSRIFYSILSSGWMYWLTMPEAFYPPFYRTPEPQFSYLLMAVVIYHAMKRKTFIPLYLAAPFLYGFLRVPYLFVVMCCHLSEINQKYDVVRLKYVNWLIGMVSYVAVSIMVGLYCEFLLKNTLTAEFLTPTRLPLFSVTFVVCLLIWVCMSRYSLKKNSKYYAFVVAAPLAAVNTQLITGFIAQPINFEQSFGVVCVSLLATAFLFSPKFDGKKWLYPTLGGLGVLLSAVYSNQIFQVNANPVLLEKPPQKLIQKLREDSFNVVFKDNALGSVMSMVLPKQPYTALAISQSYGFGASKYFDKYLCIKEKIKQEPEAYEEYKASLKVLDKGYQHLHSDFVFIHLNRRDRFHVFYDVHQKPEKCDSSKLYFYPEND